MITLNDKLPDNLVSKIQGTDDLENLKKLKQKENAALLMCGGLLGNCYLLAEIAENLMVNTLPKCKNEKWFKQDIKYNLNLSYNQLHRAIYASINNSPTNASYMREMADAMYDALKMDLFKLQNAILFELNKLKCKYSNILSEILLIDIVFKCIEKEYTEVIEHMDNIFHTYYDSWYGNAKCSGPASHWNSAVNTFANIYIEQYIDLNESKTVQDGITIIRKKLHDTKIADDVTEEASQYAEEGKGRELYNRSLEILGLNTDEKD